MHVLVSIETVLELCIMSYCAGCTFRYVNRAFTKYSLLITISHITYHWKPNDKRSCHMLLIKANEQDTSLYSNLLANSRRSSKIYTHSWRILSVLTLSLHEPKPSNFVRQIPGRIRTEPEVKLCIFLQTTEVGLPFILARINPDLHKTWSAFH